MSTWAERAKAAISKKGLGGTAKTDETPVLGLLAVSSVASMTVSALPEGLSSVLTVSGESIPALLERLSSVLTVPAPAVLEKHDFSRAVIEDPDRWCWPHSSAMTGAEIATFTARLSMFTANGLSLVDGEVLAGKLATRGRESDDRRLCLECTHLAGYAGAWSCRNSQRAGVAIKSRNTGLPADLVHQLQRCNGFKGT